MISSITIATYSVSNLGHQLLDSNEHDSMLLPSIHKFSSPKRKDPDVTLKDEDKLVNSVSRKGKGSHALTVLQKLICVKKNWFPIIDSEGYNFPGVFKHPYPQRLGYCEDITRIANFEASDPHFIFSDIQLGKGKARPKRLVQLDIAGKKESVYYRFVPCGGVKRCGKHTEGCLYVAPTSAVKSCYQHQDTPLERTGDCPWQLFSSTFGQKTPKTIGDG